VALVEEEQGTPIDKNNELFLENRERASGCDHSENFGDKKLTSF